ncbi:hypothetical protein CWB41_13820 [Methylovirgula ligni]|uniref:Uncharacterized protein n=1 Tax=Methylovirgula ligni TaxID=569860 RepID=A0A3D9YWK3_9HYPH|nr:hypothetical protein [Methylovirgula ligni]QAY96671.1 hypothetical protein CWB41_13820 [Methylovirgula ligni]REF83289.1 hypothetical protein DES32_3205 [Methylovirgula ligni]
MGEQKRRHERLGDAPIEEKYQRQMAAIAQTLDEFLNRSAKGADRKTGFVLLVYPFDGPEGARCNFISNGADRRDLCTLFREMIARFEGQPEMKGRA